jgi:predicted MFS family arabinose efflux permease
MNEPHPQGRNGSTKLLVAVLLTLLMGYGGANLMPFVVGSLVDHRGLDLPATGLLGSAELVGVALAAVGLAGLVSRGRRRGWVLAGISVASFGHGISAVDLGYEVLIASRATAGLGEGMLLAGGMAAAAGARDPTRFFAQVSAFQAVLFGVMIAAAPFVIRAFGPNGIFAALAIMTLMIAPLAAWVPDAPAPAERAVAASGPSSNRNLALLGLIALAVVVIGQMTIWVLSERLGVLAGLSAESIGVVLAVSSLAGIAGAAAAAALGTRLGRVLPVVIGLSAYACAAVAMVEINQSLVYIGSNITFGLAYFFLVPYILGALASLDRAGRWTATAAGVQMVAAATGPLLGGLLVTAGWGWVSLLILASTPIGIALLWPALRFADRDAEDGDAEGTPELSV